MRVDVALLERLAADAWPAIEQVEQDGWRLRSAAGVTRRANSALPPLRAGSDPAELDERLVAVRAFYAQRGLPARIQVSDPQLDARLAGRGWRDDAPTLVLAGPIPAEPVPMAADPHPDVVVTGSPDHDWLTCWWSVDGRGGPPELEVARGCLTRITSPAGYASVRCGGEVVAVGRGVVDQGWLGVFAMAVLPEHRRRGLAGAVLRALGEWSARDGAHSAYLQVGRDNTAARALYAANGFAPAYGYRYRYLPSA